MTLEQQRQQAAEYGLYEVPGYSRYMVSRNGEVYSLKNNKFLKLQKSTHGYYGVNLFNNKKKKYFGVHRLVAITFIENPLKKPEVNHINGIRTDNRVENLEWVTSSENQYHSIALNGIRFTNKMREELVKRNKGKFFGENYHSKKVINTETGQVFNSQKEAAIYFGINHSTLGSMLCGRKKLTKPCKRIN